MLSGIFPAKNVLSQFPDILTMLYVTESDFKTSSHHLGRNSNYNVTNEFGHLNLFHSIWGRLRWHWLMDIILFEKMQDKRYIQWFLWNYSSELIGDPKDISHVDLKLFRLFKEETDLKKGHEALRVLIYRLIYSPNQKS